MDFVTIDMEKLDNNPLSLCEIGLVKYSDGVINTIRISCLQQVYQETISEEIL